MNPSCVPTNRAVFRGAGGELMPVGLVRACCESLNGQRAVAAAAQAAPDT